ncbi:MAG: ATP-grasp domain-containing protein [Clostridia bacterium]|nr:ATP-grasp domain-containing protein [Clostridia bacterium]
MNILITSVGRRVELMQAFARAAEIADCDLVIHGADITDTAPALAFCDRTVIVPRIKDEAYIPTLLDYCKQNHIDALIPTIDTDLLLLSKNKARFMANGTLVVISEEDKIAVCRDKRLTSDYFESVGLAAPAPVDDYTKYTGGFPAFIKPKDGSSSISAYKVSDSQELENLSKLVPDYIIQPCIEGTEYTVDVFCDFDGNPIYITPRIRLAVRSGEVLKTQIAQDDVIIAEIKQLLADYRPCGAITVQLIRQNGTGKNYYIEINPRYGGGAPLSIKAGADSPTVLLRLLMGEKVGYQDKTAEDGAVYCRFDQSIRVK